MNHPRVHKCREWVEMVAKQTKGSPVVQKAIENPRPTIYGIGFFLVAIWILARALQLFQRSRTSQVRPSTPDLEKERVPARSFKAPQRPPGGNNPIGGVVNASAYTEFWKYGHPWISKDQPQLQLQTGTFTPQNQTRTDPSDTASTTSQWV